jgi:hypothetical protein
MLVREMLQTHVHPYQHNLEAMVQCIEACYECAQACTSCADACLGEPDLQNLRRCITLNLNCAAICEATGQILSRQTDTDWNLLLSQINTCLAACKLCGDECQKHAHHHQHCQVCANACRRCEEACQRLTASVPSRAH